MLKCLIVFHIRTPKPVGMASARKTTYSSINKRPYILPIRNFDITIKTKENARDRIKVPADSSDNGVVSTEKGLVVLVANRKEIPTPKSKSKQITEA